MKYQIDAVVHEDTDTVSCWVMLGDQHIYQTQEYGWLRNVPPAVRANNAARDWITQFGLPENM